MANPLDHHGPRGHIHDLAWLRGKALDVALILLGGALGTAARVGASWAAGRWLGHLLPAAILDILLVNVSGSFLLGVLAGVVPAEARHRHPHWLVGSIGFLGAYTTFSSLAYGSVELLRAGQTAVGLLYPLGSLALGVAAVGLGDLVGVWMTRRRDIEMNGSGDAPLGRSERLAEVDEWAEGLLDDNESAADAPPRAEAARERGR